jgi:transcriptional regulator with XRE-family HTH domain
VKPTRRAIVLTPGQRIFAELGEKQIVLAHMLGVTPQFVGQLASGRARPSIDHAALIQDLFGIPMRDWSPPPTKAALSLESSPSTDGSNKDEKSRREAAE